MNYLFDLDGTLTDPATGITRSLQHALEGLGRPPRDAGELRRFIGPPLRTAFAELLETDDGPLIERAVDLYRERFAPTGLYENAVYPDVVPALERLVARGHRLWVVTSKPRVYASRIIEHFGMRSLFQAVYGSELDGAYSDKRDLVRLVLDETRLDAADSWMVGDRAVDVGGGRANGTGTVGVLWGYGSEDELRAAAPDAIITSMDELPLDADRIRQ